MGDRSDTFPAVRAPKQHRSRDSWERVLRCGGELFSERGWEGFTITEVCHRARVSAPSIYARVDGKAGLFRAVHARWLEQIRGDELALESAADAEATPQDAAAAAAEVVVRLFNAHHAMLRAVSDRAPHDTALLASGAAASRGLIERLADSIPIAPADAESIVRTVYAECVLRNRYGPGFLTAESEDDEAFLERMRRLARILTAGSAAPDS